MLRQAYRWLAFTGIFLLAFFGCCEAFVADDTSGLHLDFGIGIYIILAVYYFLMFLFFILALYYQKSLNKKILIAITILGLLTIILPADGAWRTLTIWFKPQEHNFINFDLFPTSALRKNINAIEKVIFVPLFICQLSIIILSFRIKKSFKSLPEL